MKSFKEITPNVSFSAEELKVLELWRDRRVFEKSVASRPADKAYSFYDGPPFATGLPHYGHLLASTLKDIVPRYWTMKGRRVERRFGWDCHGLPIEYEIDKTLGLSGRKGVEEFGIARYNAECRRIVLRYTEEWEKTVTRLGRWVDFRGDYKTMDPTFMESVWWVFKGLWDKGLIYKSYRVMPYSTAVATPLSNFEAGSNYKDVQDAAITVRFRAKDFENTSFLGWTTTPWTLPSNLALAVGGELGYVRIFSKKHGEHFILGSARVAHYFPKQEDYDILQEWTGHELKGLSYEPLFPYFASRIEGGAFRVLLGSHVTEDDGTAIVHTAPAFGEEDFDACRANGIALVMPVDDDGKFTAEVADYAGRHVRDADKDIIKRLKDEGKLLRHDTLAHSVPFCWRSDTPLIYRAVSGWFVRVEALKDALLSANAETHWVPEHLRDGRFGNWLKEARDWNISRNRYWGNPIPLWIHETSPEDPKGRICVGGIKELEGWLKGKVKVTDLHRESLDGLVIEVDDKTARERGVLPGSYRRVPEVLDCWFESGAMPYAQGHYPFENKADFEKSFPADFIAEGLDQTRGWFYTLTVLGTALFGKSPFRNVVVNGIIVAGDGKKMSKRLKNYPDPAHILDTYGADALRLYLINSPVVRAEELRFSEAGVKDIVRRVLLKWWNAYTFFVSYAVIDKWNPDLPTSGLPDIPTSAHSDIGTSAQSPNILDRWIISRLQSLLLKTEREMAQYHLYNVVPALLDFIEDLTNTYIRLNRDRFWGEGITADKTSAYQTLYTVLVSLAKAMAPFTPFVAETMYQNLKGEGSRESVHLEDYPTADEGLISNELEESVSLMNRVLLMGRNLREKRNIKVKIPLKNLTVIHRERPLLDEVKALEVYVRGELNVRAVTYAQNEDDYVELTAKANGAVLGKKLGSGFGEVNKAVSALGGAELTRLEHGATLKVAGVDIARDDVLIYRKPRPGHDNLATDAFMTVELDATLGPDQIREGLAREVVNRIQNLRKNAGLRLSDRIALEYRAEGELAEAIRGHADYIREQTLCVAWRESPDPRGESAEACEVEGSPLRLALRRAG